MFRALAILFLAALTAACGTRPQTTERKGRIIALTDSILTTGGTDTFGASAATNTSPQFSQNAASSRLSNEQ